VSRPGGVVSPPGTWPEVNDRVRVRLELPPHQGGDEIDLRTRVEDVHDGLLVVAAPTFAGDLHVAQEGLPVTLSWATARGQCLQAFVLTTVVRRSVPCWELHPAGEVVHEQRRRFVRVPVIGLGRLSAVPAPADAPAGTSADAPAPGDPHVPAARGAGGPGGLQSDGSAADGSGESGDAEETSLATALVDLSEGGACVRSRAASWLAAGRRVVLTFEVDGGTVEQLTDVLRVTRSDGPSALDTTEQRFDAVLSFVEPVSAADRVRRHVMKIQIENRRRGER